MAALAASAKEAAKKAAEAAQIGQKDPARFPTWPEIKHFFNIGRPDDEMFARVLCYPPLGQATVVEAGKKSVVFYVVLEVGRDAGGKWEVELWCDRESEWAALTFEEREGLSIVSKFC